MISRWRALILGISALLALVALPLYAVKIHRKTDYTDFSVYYLAGSRMKAGNWEKIYTLEDGASPFRYAPATLPLFRPFAEVSPAAARMSWYFLQFAWFALGYWLIRRALQSIKVREASAISALSMLFILRFILDCFTIGQISSLLFLGLCAGFLGWILGRPWVTGAALFVPTLFKIGPGFLYFLFLSARRRRLVRGWAAAAGIFVALSAWVGAWVTKVAGPGLWMNLWKSWIAIVAADSQYYDASHYGSQSLKSALLRLARDGILSERLALSISAASAVAGCVALILFWLFRRPRSLRGRGLFYALGIFPYLWFMPETFKYSLTTLAIPVALLLASDRRTRLTQGALLFGFLTLSLAGKDLLDPLGALLGRETLFFDLQRASLPFLATVLIAAAVLREAFGESVSSRLGRNVRDILLPAPIGPWPRDPEPPSLSMSLLAPLPMDRTSSLTPKQLDSFLEEHLRALRVHGQSFELLLLPYGDRASRENPLTRAAARWAETAAEVRFDPALGQVTSSRAEALRAGFLSSRGARLGFASLEQPCDPVFFTQAGHALERAEADLVRADRRDPRSRFRVPVRLLSLVYGRHRMGLAFNRVVRAILPIEARDTHSGTLLLSRALARRIFSLQSSAGVGASFLFDLEISLIARGHGFEEKSLPVSLWLADEKRFLRMWKETWSILLGLPRLAIRTAQGRYHPGPLDVLERGPHDALWITADDWGMSPGVNQGILELARAGVVRRTSMMARARYLEASFSELKAIPGFQLGLHLDLTSHGRSPGSVLLEWLDPRSDRATLRESVREEFRSQLGRLRELGAEVTYLDGHHHIHLVPGILDSIADLVREAGIRQVRLPEDPALWLSGKFPLLILCKLARKRLEAHEFRSLPCFYPSGAHFHDPSLLLSALSVKRDHEIIVHPAAEDDIARLGIADSYTAGRVTEYQALRMLIPERRDG